MSTPPLINDPKAYVAAVQFRKLDKSVNGLQLKKEVQSGSDIYKYELNERVFPVPKTEKKVELAKAIASLVFSFGLAWLSSKVRTWWREGTSGERKDIVYVKVSETKETKTFKDVHGKSSDSGIQSKEEEKAREEVKEKGGEEVKEKGGEEIKEEEKEEAKEKEIKDEEKETPKELTLEEKKTQKLAAKRTKYELKKQKEANEKLEAALRAKEEKIDREWEIEAKNLEEEKLALEKKKAEDLKEKLEKETRRQERANEYATNVPMIKTIDFDRKYNADQDKHLEDLHNIFRNCFPYPNVESSFKNQPWEKLSFAEQKALYDKAKELDVSDIMENYILDYETSVLKTAENKEVKYPFYAEKRMSFFEKIKEAEGTVKTEENVKQLKEAAYSFIESEVKKNIKSRSGVSRREANEIFNAQLKRENLKGYLELFIKKQGSNLGLSGPILEKTKQDIIDTTRPKLTRQKNDLVNSIVSKKRR